MTATSTVTTLRTRGLKTGSVTRPAGSYRYGPKGGTTVAWVLSQPVADMLTQGAMLGWANKGTIGNPDHLRLWGDHTPWSKGKTPGVLYAKDTEIPADAGRRALQYLCRLADYDTTWVDFWNEGGRQYDRAGRDVGWSGDVHLHVSVRAGYELVHTTLFLDMAAVIAGTFRQAKDDDDMNVDELKNATFNVDRNGDGKLEPVRLADVVGQLVGKQLEMQQQLAAIAKKLGA